MISFAVTAKLIVAFVFAYTKRWFSHDAAKISDAENDVFEHVSDHSFRWRIIMLHVRITKTPYEPTFLYSEIGVYRGIIFYRLLKNMCCRYTLKCMC